MTPSTLEYTQAAQDKLLDAVRQTQTAVVDAVGAWAKAVDAATPDLPAVPLPPGVPTVHELIRTSFGFADKVLEAQRQFAENLASAAAPVLKVERIEERAA
jgi:hypothetical protein